MKPGDLAPLELQLKPFPGGLVVKVVGELDLSAESRIRALTDLPEAQGESMLLDLADLSFIDSFGVKAIMALRQNHPGLRYYGSSGVVARVLEIAGLDDALLPAMDQVDRPASPGRARS